MGDIFTTSRIDAHVRKLFRDRFVVLNNNDKGEKSAASSMVQRLSELRKKGRLIVAYDDNCKRTVFVLGDGVMLSNSHRYRFGGRLMRYVLTGHD